MSTKTSYKSKKEKVEKIKENMEDQAEKLKEEIGEKAGKIKTEVKAELEEKSNKMESEKSPNIFGIKIWRIMLYFALYSFLGFCIETVYGLLTKGVIESRKSFLWGPFCGIYGLGAIIMILALQRFKKNNYTLFLGGYIVGSAIEYFVSLFGEIMLNVKWWDYSNEPFNINGRVCLFYSIAWGLLAIYLIKHVHPGIDNFIDKYKSKLPKYLLPIIVDCITLFLLVDCIISAIAINIFYSRLVHDYNLNIPNSEYYIAAYENRDKTSKWYEFTEKHFSNERMLKTYPNLKMQDVNGNILFVKDVLHDIKPYYVKVYTPKEKYIKFTNVETVNYDE